MSQKMRASYRLLLAVAISGVLALAGFLGWQFLMSDKCLDAGGAWDYAARRCDTAPDKESLP